LYYINCTFLVVGCWGNNNIIHCNIYRVNYNQYKINQCTRYIKPKHDTMLNVQKNICQISLISHPLPPFLPWGEVPPPLLSHLRNVGGGTSRMMHDSILTVPMRWARSTSCRTCPSTTSTASLSVDDALLSDPHLSTPCSHGETNNASAEEGWHQPPPHRWLILPVIPQK
jgi:hypothetical protein